MIDETLLGIILAVSPIVGGIIGSWLTNRRRDKFTQERERFAIKEKIGQMIAELMDAELRHITNTYLERDNLDVIIKGIDETNKIEIQMLGLVLLYIKDDEKVNEFKKLNEIRLQIRDKISKADPYTHDKYSQFLEEAEDTLLKTMEVLRTSKTLI